MKKNKFFRHPKALIARGAKIGDKTRVWAFTNIQKGAQIGKNCNICDTCFIESGAKVGNKVTLKNGVNVFSGITLEDDVFCGANTAFINDRYPRSHRHDPWMLEKTLVKKGATIGSNAVIMCGITIGEYALIGAGSVVTLDVPAHTIVAGKPARAFGYVCGCGRKLSPQLKCVCGQAYVRRENTLQIKKS